MKRYLLKALCIFALCFIYSGFAEAQNYHQLTIDDFTGAPERNTGNIAYTNCSIVLNYKAKKMRSGYYLLSFDIPLTLNNNRSWMNKSLITSEDMLAEVLKHEQGHYTIAYMEQQELLREYGKTVFLSDYAYRVMEIFKRVDAKYKRLNEEYDEDTTHMLNREHQANWDNYFQKQMEYYAES